MPILTDFERLMDLTEKYFQIFAKNSCIYFHIVVIYIRNQVLQEEKNEKQGKIAAC